MKGKASPGFIALQVEVLAAAEEELRRVGPTGFRTKAVVEAFEDRGASRATLYRWVGHVVSSGALGQEIATAVKGAAARRAAEELDPEIFAAKHLLEAMPDVVNLDDVGGSGTTRVLDNLHACINAARAVMSFASDANGKPRAAKLLLFGSEHLRRCVETSMRILEKIHDVQKIDEFHRAMMEEIRKESPACAKRVLERLEVIARRYETV